MKLGISINYFPDCKQFINDCIKSASGLCDHLSVVYSLESNCGKVKFKDHGIESGLCDVYQQYKPAAGLDHHTNEFQKRLIGQQIAKDAGCTHFLTMDADEFYHWTEFKAAINQIKHFGWKVTAVPIRSYYGDTEHWYDEHFFVPFIHEIGCTYIFNTDWPLLADPTRKVKANVVDVPTVIRMHHYTYVRDNIRLKLECSSARSNRNPKLIAQVEEHYRNWQPGQPGLIIRKGQLASVYPTAI